MNKGFHPMVSIVIPVYNGANYIREAIDSALAQTYDNIEILVINDGSKDNTEEIAKSYGDKIRYFAKENGGTPTALNMGIANMRGEYFSWLSHDDLYYPNKIQQQIIALSKLPDKDTIIMSDLDGIDGDYKKIYQTNYIQHIEQFPPRKHSRIHPIIYNQTHGCTLLIPKVCFDCVGNFDVREVVAHDFEFFYRAFLKFPHKLLPKVLVTARDSSTRQGVKKKQRCNEEYSRLFMRIIENLSEEDIELLAPSRLDFYKDMRTFFSDAEYSIALKYINEKILANLQISYYDLLGSRFNGHDLHFYLREQGMDSKQLVLHKDSQDDNTFEFHFQEPGAIKELIQKRIFTDADLIHFHLLHGKFDVNYLPLISNLKPTVLTLHDLYFLGGHCVAHGDCEKWKTHCADCQYLNEIFAIDRDISALNFSITKSAIQNSQISAIVASNWMKQKVESSPIWKGKTVYHLPFGIDQKIYSPGDTKAARKRHGIPENDIVLMFRNSSWGLKGRDIIIKALLSLQTTENITLITVDQKGLTEEVNRKFKIIEFGWLNDDDLMASLYNACDMFLMPSRQDTFGLMAVEAMSCGKMVLALEGNATAVPEVINAPSCGIAVKESDYAEELSRLIANKREVLERGQKSLEYARECYSKEAYVQGMMRIYSDVVSNHKITSEMDLLLQQLKKYSNAFTFNYAAAPASPVAANVVNHQGNNPAKRSVFRRVVVKCARISFRIIKKVTEALGVKKMLKKTGLYKKLHAKGIMDKLNL